MKFPRFLLFALFPLAAMAEPMTPTPLFPEGVPGEADLELPEETAIDKDQDGVVRISNVATPTLTIYPAPAGLATGTAILVSPGGGYNILASRHEGSEVCKWLNSIGITAGLLKYRVPRRVDRPPYEAPLEDAAAALRQMRAQAEDLKIDPERIGALGFSAGGHLSLKALTSLPRGERANFGVLIYPAYLQSEKDPDALAPDITVDADTPPLFIAVGHEDRRWVEGAALLYLGMRRAEASAELHIYGQGGHGFGITGKPELHVNDWPERAEDWMKAMGLLEGPGAE